jgi:hypothetical protein
VDVETTISIHLITTAGEGATALPYNISEIFFFCITLWWASYGLIDVLIDFLILIYNLFHTIIRILAISF